ncbi:hypothetical protein DFH27DRAFT_608297 [Peziza echinospora]|nr:hypothetical protein DFH27DRAFT_608297 [Peziza echinospora]
MARLGFLVQAALGLILFNPLTASAQYFNVSSSTISHSGTGYPGYPGPTGTGGLPSALPTYSTTIDFPYPCPRGNCTATITRTVCNHCSGHPRPTTITLTKTCEDEAPSTPSTSECPSCQTRTYTFTTTRKHCGHGKKCPVETVTSVVVGPTGLPGNNYTVTTTTPPMATYTGGAASRRLVVGGLWSSREDGGRSGAWWWKGGMAGVVVGLVGFGAGLVM